MRELNIARFSVHRDRHGHCESCAVPHRKLPSRCNYSPLKAPPVRSPAGLLVLLLTTLQSQRGCEAYFSPRDTFFQVFLSLSSLIIFYIVILYSKLELEIHKYSSLTPSHSGNGIIKSQFKVSKRPDTSFS